MNWIAFAVGSTLCAGLLIGTLAVAGESWIKARMKEKTSQIGIAAALMSTAQVASLPTSYEPAGAVAWLSLIPVWTAAVILVCMPEAGSAIPPIQSIPAAPAAPQTAQEGQ